MKLIKSLILGSAAGVLAMSGAQAADLPAKAKAVEYVKICSLYGAGYSYIPGTDTCIKLGGYARIDTTFNGGVYDQPYYAGDGGQRNRYIDRYFSRSRMALTVDTRTATEYGLVRTFAQGDFQFNNVAGTTNPAVLTAAGTNSNLLSTPGGGYVAVEMVFLQFAGFTFGKSASAYATPWHGYPGNNTSFLLGGNDSSTGVNNIQYTAQFGNGVSSTFGLQDPTVFNRTTLANLTTVNAFAAGSQGYAGTYSPDVAGNIRVDQAWGLFQLSGAAHEVRAAYNGISGTAGIEPLGHPETKWGGSVMAALQIKNLPTGAGDDIKFDASWSKGDTKQVISTSGASPSFLMYGDTGRAGAYQSIGFGATTDATFLPIAAGGDGTIHLTEAWGVRGAFNHNWNPYWSTSVFGSYTSVRYDDVPKANICARIGLVLTPGSTCNPDFNTSQLGAITRWTPVKNLTFSAEVQWFHLDQKFSGAATFAANGPKPAAVYEFKDQDTVSLNVRAQRNF
ncbi:MAG: porin [Bradyrhizobium sp.]